MSRIKDFVMRDIEGGGTGRLSAPTDINRAASISTLRESAEVRSDCIAKSLVSRQMGEIVTHQISLGGWLFWIYVYPDGSQKVVC